MILYCIEYISRHYAFKLIIVTIPDYTWVEPFLKFFFLGVGGWGLTLCASNMLVYHYYITRLKKDIWF